MLKVVRVHTLRTHMFHFFSLHPKCHRSREKAGEAKESSRVALPHIARFSAIDSHYLTGCREGGGAAGELALCGMNRGGRGGRARAGGGSLPLRVPPSQGE